MTEPESDWPKRAEFNEFYELDATMFDSARKVVDSWPKDGTTTGENDLIEMLCRAYVPTTWDRSKVERFIVKLRTG